LSFEAFLSDGVVALNASAVGSLGDTFQRFTEADELSFLAATQFESHLLGLHGIHTGEATDGGVELDGGGGGAGLIEVAPQFRRFVFEDCTKSFLRRFIHHPTLA